MTDKILSVLVIIVMIGFIAVLLRPINMKVKESKTILCIVGEAEGESMAGKIGVAHAIINRGTLRGIKGCTSERVKCAKYTVEALAQSGVAWVTANNTHKRYDPVKDADSWMTVKSYEDLNWPKKCVPTVVIGKHVFLKCRKK